MVAPLTETADRHRQFNAREIRRPRAMQQQLPLSDGQADAPPFPSQEEVLSRDRGANDSPLALRPIGDHRKVSVREDLHGHARRRPGVRLTGSTTAFGRHESFPLRFGWITKGLQALADDPKIFTRDDATVVLGVGKNMVASIRYWLQATRIAHRDPKANTLKPTPIAEIVFGDDGDPYLEDEGTIWLLHWLLATNPKDATAIYWFFNHFHKPTFNKCGSRRPRSQTSQSANSPQEPLRLP